MALRAPLSRYRDFAKLVAKYGHLDFVAERSDSGDAPRGDAEEAKAFAADL